ncbi:hypothetical protein B0H13DRAFT_2364162 [Mycena leptocephala]|nr:hypothetical protein B0H13DRAFT_2364162 [Mycena leptocephala]
MMILTPHHFSLTIFELIVDRYILASTFADPPLCIRPNSSCLCLGRIPFDPRVLYAVVLITAVVPRLWLSGTQGSTNCDTLTLRLAKKDHRVATLSAKNSDSVASHPHAHASWFCASLQHILRFEFIVAVDAVIVY